MIIKIQPILVEEKILDKAFEKLEGKAFKEYMNMFMYLPHPAYGERMKQIEKEVLDELVSKKFIKQLKGELYCVYIAEWYCGI